MHFISSITVTVCCLACAAVKGQDTAVPPVPGSTHSAVVPLETIIPQIILPSIGEVRNKLQARLIPDPFCEIEASRQIDEEPAKTQARCCDAEDSTDKTPQQKNPCNQSSSSPKGATRIDSFVFDNAAHFAVCESESCAISGLDTPYVIYEGMSVRVTADGRYEVRAMVDGPRIPAILRLQLQFVVSGAPVTVTLPPIRLTPNRETEHRLPNQTQTWLVRRTGYSHRLSGLLPSPQGFSVRRNGTAEIGQVPAL